MGGHEFDESTKPKDSAGEAGGLRTAVQEQGERHSTAEMKHDQQVATARLEEKGVLPTLSFEAERNGTQLSGQELKSEGIKCEKHDDGKGNSSSTVEFPNGVKIENSHEKPNKVSDHGAVVTDTSGHMVVLPKDGHYEQGKDGTIIDKKTGHPVLKENEDGTTTVYTDKGVYTAHPDGSVDKEPAIKNMKNGKWDGTWTVLDTKDPLGGLNLDDMDDVKRSTHKKH